MSNEKIDLLAKEIALKLVEISQKEEQVIEVKSKIDQLKEQIKQHEETKRLLEQEIQSDKFIISEKLNRQPDNSKTTSTKPFVVSSDYGDGY